MNELQLLERGQAYGQYEYVTVTFPTANTDTRIAHQLKAVPYTEVYYSVVKKDKATDIFTGTAAWSAQFIILQSSVANATVTLLLFTRN